MLTDGSVKNPARSARPAPVRELQHVEALVERLGLYANRIRAAIDAADEHGDKSTADLYTEISRTADKRLWFLEAHLQGRKRS